MNFNFSPENAPRLYDLVRVEDERVLPAFYFSLRNTLVATDLEQGTRIAYGSQRYRVVTLNGDVIETSGTMSGGGRSQIRGKMGTKITTKTKESNETSLISQKVLEDLQLQAEQLQLSINYSQEEVGRLESELIQLNRNKTHFEAETQKLSITINSLAEQIPRIESQLREQKIRKEKTTSDATKVASITAEIDSKKIRLDESEKEAQKVTSLITDINDKVKGIREDKVGSVQTKIKNIDKQIKSLNGNISKLKVETTTSERNVKKTEKLIESLKNDILKAQNDIMSLDDQRKNIDLEIVELKRKLQETIKEIDASSEELSKTQSEIQNIQKKESEEKLNRVQIEQRLHDFDAKIAVVESKLPRLINKLKHLKLHVIPDKKDLSEPLKTYTVEELDDDKQSIAYNAVIQEEQLRTKKPNLSVIDDYTNKKDVYLERVKILEDITLKRNDMRKLYDDVRKKRYNEFMNGFHIITRKLKEMYQMITQGGDAELELVDSMDPFTEGVSFGVRPPRKTWKNISNLSGGEKTLSSLALVFALHYYKPSPLYFMDEIDAALDFKNVSIVAHYIKVST